MFVFLVCLLFQTKQNMFGSRSNTKQNNPKQKKIDQVGKKLATVSKMLPKSNRSIMTCVRTRRSCSIFLSFTKLTDAPLVFVDCHVFQIKPGVSCDFGFCFQDGVAMFCHTVIAVETAGQASTAIIFFDFLVFFLPSISSL